MKGFESYILDKIQAFCSDVAHDTLRIAAEKRVFYGTVDFEDKIKLSQYVQQGISIDFFQQLIGCLPFTETDWSRYLDLSTKSFHRYYKTSDFTFKPIHSEKILELAEVMIFGLNVFGDAGEFKSWLYTPTMVFNNQNPIDFLYDSYGKELVMAELNRIEHGIFV